MDLPKTFCGAIVHGFQRGSTILGFATVNIEVKAWAGEISEEWFGVYAGIVRLADDYERVGVMSIGKNVTFAAEHPTFEVHILDFDRDIYDDTIEIELTTFVRKMVKFNSVEELKASINHTTSIARERVGPLLVNLAN